MSESEAEDDPDSHVTLPQKISTRGNIPLNQSSVRLIEQGPRMTLKLFKIEEGFICGEVLYHCNITKTEEEKAAILERRLEKQRMKEARKREQEQRKKIKELAKQKSKEKSLLGQKKLVEAKSSLITDPNDGDLDEDDDAEWYKTEVGKAPDKDLFNSSTKIKTNKSLSCKKKPKQEKNQSINFKVKNTFKKKFTKNIIKKNKIVKK